MLQVDGRRSPQQTLLGQGLGQEPLRLDPGGGGLDLLEGLIDDLAQGAVSRTPTMPAVTALPAAWTKVASVRFRTMVCSVVVVPPIVNWLGLPSASVMSSRVAQSSPFRFCITSMYAPSVATAGVPPSSILVAAAAVGSMVDTLG